MPLARGEPLRDQVLACRRGRRCGRRRGRGRECRDRRASAPSRRRRRRCPPPQSRSISAAIARSQGQRSSSVSGWPALILATLLAGETGRRRHSASRGGRRGVRQSCSCPSRRRPSPPARRGSHWPRKSLRKRGLIDQPDRLADRTGAPGRQVLACEHARQDRALAGARDLEQHFAAGGERGQRQADAGNERLDIGAGHADDPARGFLDRGIIRETARRYGRRGRRPSAPDRTGGGRDRAPPRHRTISARPRRARRYGRDRPGRRLRSGSDGCSRPARTRPERPRAPCSCCGADRLPARSVHRR